MEGQPLPSSKSPPPGPARRSAPGKQVQELREASARRVWWWWMLPTIGYTSYLATQEHGISQWFSGIIAVSGVVLTIQEFRQRARDRSASIGE